MIKSLFRAFDPTSGSTILSEERIYKRGASLRIGASLRMINGNKKIAISFLSGDGETHVILEPSEAMHLAEFLTKSVSELDATPQTPTA